MTRDIPQLTPPIDPQVIAAAHLFGDAKSERVVAQVDETHLPVSAAPLKLTGTLASRNPKRGSAIISGQGASKHYRVGAAVEDAKMVSVYADHVVLQRDGQLEALYLPRAAGSPTAVQTNNRTSNPPATQTRSVREPKVSSIIRVAGGVTDESGRLTAFRVYPARDRAKFTSTGLRPGDLVVAVNGNSVSDQDRTTGGNAFGAIADSSHAVITIERFGQRSEITLEADESSEAE